MIAIKGVTDIESLMQKIRAKANNASDLAKVVTETPALLAFILDGVCSPEPEVKFKCAKILKTVSEMKPEVLYPHFEFFESLLDNANNILKWIAIDVLSSLVAVDSDNRFEPLFPKYYSLLKEGNLVTAAHVVECSPTIVKARPDWETKITQALLDVEKVPLPTAECRNILQGKVILAFAQYVNQSGSKQAMLLFARKLLNNTRPATKKKAELFLRKYSFRNG